MTEATSDISINLTAGPWVEMNWESPGDLPMKICEVFDSLQADFLLMYKFIWSNHSLRYPSQVFSSVKITLLFDDNIEKDKDLKIKPYVNNSG